MPSVSLVKEIARIAKIDLFGRDPTSSAPLTGRFIGRPFYLDYATARLLVADAWKRDAGGLPQGSFLLAYYDAEESVREAVLLRVLNPAPLPTDSDVIASMVEYYKDNLKMSGKSTQLDTYTRYEFSFSGLECRTLGTFYEDDGGKITFGADVENFFSAHNYSVITDFNCQAGFFCRNQWITMPDCERVKAVNAPTANSGTSACESP